MKKTLQKIIIKLADNSFRDGQMQEHQVTKAIKILKSQPDAIQALSEYLRQIKRKQREHTMFVETVVPLSPTQIKKMKNIVEKKKKITKIITDINPYILGGFKLTVGDDVWDESILGKIHQVKGVISGGSN